MTPVAMMMVGDKAREFYDRLAKERQATSTGGARPQLVETVPQAVKARSRDQAGKAVGVSGRTMDKARKVREKGSPALVKAVESGTIDVTKAGKIAEPTPVFNVTEDWIDANQAARRNLSPDKIKLIIGRRYNRRKKSQGGQEGNTNAGKRSGQNDHFVSPTDKTAEHLAKEHGVSEATVRRAGRGR